MTIEFIQSIVCEILGVSQEHLYDRHKGAGIKRNRPVVDARHWIRYFARRETMMSLSLIGDKTGHADHTTVIHSCTYIQDMMDVSREFREKHTEIQKAMNQFTEIDKDIEPLSMSAINLTNEASRQAIF